MIIGQILGLRYSTSCHVLTRLYRLEMAHQEGLVGISRILRLAIGIHRW